VQIADRDMGQAPVSAEVRCREAANGSGVGILSNPDASGGLEICVIRIRVPGDSSIRTCAPGDSAPIRSQFLDGSEVHIGSYEHLLNRP
jgi:hypothetical protein